MSKSGSNRPLSELPVIGIDTEAADDRLILCLAANESGHAWHVANPDGLKTEQIFCFLLTLPKGIKTGFFFNYDATMILRDIGHENLQRLRSRNRCYWGDWRIEHIPGKKFSVSNRIMKKSVTVWDVSGWYPSSFASLIERWGLGTKKQRALIRRMKKKRSQFQQEKLSKVIEYTTLECRLLAEWVRTLLDLHEQVGLHLQSYCGAGATAAAVFRLHGFRPPEVRMEVNHVGELAYYGGRSEISLVGEVPGPVYAYDIHSAYPAALAELPDITGRWRWTRGAPEKNWFGFALVRWDIPAGAVWGPFPVRTLQTETGRTVSLVYPLRGFGWYHSAEVITARRIFGKRIRVDESWVLDENGAQPFSWVRELAKKRLVLKAAGHPSAYVLKVGLNSLYGKLAQRTGEHPYQSMALAAAITAATRARLLEVAGQHPHETLLLATDGILMRRRIPEIVPGDKLGDWELTEHSDDAFIAQAGVYWIGRKIRTRGFESSRISRAAVLRAWRRNRTDGRVDVAVRRFIGYRLACSRGKPELSGTWETLIRRLSLSPLPRRIPISSGGQFVLTRPATVREARTWLMLPHWITGWIDDEDQPDWMQDDVEVR